MSDAAVSLAAVAPPAPARVVLVSITVTRAQIVFTEARCPTCRRRIMSIPGVPLIEVRAVGSDAERSGRGRVVRCGGCKTLCETIEHRRP